jgi:hypothetical protein
VRSSLLIAILFLATFASAQGQRARFHVTKVKHPDTSDASQASVQGFEMEYKVWGYTRTTEYMLSCTEVWKVDNGTPKVDYPCAPMNTGTTYEVKVFSRAILYPAEQPNQPTYAWYMVREEREKPAHR